MLGGVLEMSLKTSLRTAVLQVYTHTVKSAVYFTFFLSLQNKYMNWYFQFWQVKPSHAAFLFGTLARVMVPASWNADQILSVCAASHNLTALQDVCLNYFQVSLVIQLEFPGSASQPPQRPTAYLITVKPCDGKPSLNNINLKHTQKQIPTRFYVTLNRSLFLL